MNIYLRNDKYEWELFDSNSKVFKHQLKKNNIVLGNGVVLGYGVKLGNGVVLGYGVKLGNGVELGDEVKLGNGVVLGDGVKLGNGVVLKKDYTPKQLIAGSLGVLPDNKGNYTLYKRVNKISKGKYSSCYDSKFVYEDSKIAKAENPDENENISCGKGLHVSTPYYWQKGNTLIQVQVNLKDVITCREGKLRVRKLKVIGEVKL